MTDLRLGNISRNAVAQHAVMNEHQMIDWEQCQVLCRAENHHKRQKLESWEIHKLTPSMN